jgi:hypothetical protein
MNEEIQKELASLRERVKALEAQATKIEDDVIDYINKHSDRHLEMNRMVRASYYVTHPEYVDTLQQMHEIFHKKKDSPDDKKD